MVDLLYELGASLDIKNRQGLTPLTLAAVKAHKEVREEKFDCLFLFIFNLDVRSYSTKNSYSLLAIW
jgi:ankyrin repeat protein